MPHGSTEKCEPNFTPLLDLVLQLVMFFMLCANFVLEQTSADIKLPEANAAKALDRSEGDAIFLNVNKEGTVELAPSQRRGDQPTLDNAIQVEGFMKDEAKLEKRAAESRGERWEKPKATVILRVDKETRFEKTYAIMRACRQAGYEKV